MNAVEFKKGIEENKVKNIEKFLVEYKEEWGETIEDSIDKLLGEYITDGNTEEPLLVDTIKSRVVREYGEWGDATEYEYNNPHKFKDNDYECQARYVEINKRRLFRSVKINVKKYEKRIRELHKSYAYNNASEMEGKYIKKIFEDKGFGIEEGVISHMGGYRTDTILIYWNDVPIKD